MGRVFFAVCIVASVYSLAVWWFAPDKVWLWWNTFVGSTVSFLFAVTAGLYLFQRQSNAKNKSERESLRSLLSAELSDLKRILSDTDRLTISCPSGRTVGVLITYVQPLATEKAAASSLFLAAETENLLHLARKVRMLNLKTQYLLGLIPARAEEAVVVHAADNVEQTRVAVLEDIDFITRTLGLTLSQHQPRQ